MNQHQVSLLSVLILLGGLATAAERSGYSIYQPTITTLQLMHPVTGQSISGHDSTIAWFQDRWIWQWDDGTEQAGQRIRQSTSTDLRTWSAPIEVFTSTIGSVNPLTETATATQWQPCLVRVGTELWCVWTSSGHGLVFARLRTPDGRWEHTKIALLPAGQGTLFAGNGGLVASTGRVMIPVTHRWPNDNPQEDKVVYTDDGGGTWQISQNGVRAPTGGSWESTVWEPQPGCLMLISRNTKITSTGSPVGQAIGYSSSPDLGVTWTTAKTFLPMELANSRPHVRTYQEAGIPRHVMVQHDYWTSSLLHNDQRRNLTLFFTRGSGVDFTAGTSFVTDDRNCDYPQMDIRDDLVAIVWTWNRTLMTKRPQMLTTIQPLPDPARWYVFPRSGKGHTAPVAATVDGRTCLRMVNDFSSAGVDLDANLPRRDRVRMSVDIRVESGASQTLLTIGHPALRISAESGRVMVRGPTEALDAGAISGWTRLEVLSLPDAVEVAVAGGAAVRLAHALGQDGRWLYLGQGSFKGLTAKTATAFLVDVGSITTEVLPSADRSVNIGALDALGPILTTGSVEQDFLLTSPLGGIHTFAVESTRDALLHLTQPTPIGDG